MKKICSFLLLGAGIFLIADGVPAAEKAKSQSGIVAAEIATFSKHLSIRPQTAIDLSAVSGAY